MASKPDAVVFGSDPGQFPVEADGVDDVLEVGHSPLMSRTSDKRLGGWERMLHDGQAERSLPVTAAVYGEFGGPKEKLS